MDLDWRLVVPIKKTRPRACAAVLRGALVAQLFAPRQGWGLFPLCTTARKYLNRHAGIAVNAYKKIVGGS